MNKELPKLTYTPMPEQTGKFSSVQMGIFDEAQDIERAMDYVKPYDDTVKRDSAKVLCTVRTKDNPEHEIIVLIAAKLNLFPEYGYLVHSNTKEIQVPANWMSAGGMLHEVRSITAKLKDYGHEYEFIMSRELEKVIHQQKKTEENSVKQQAVMPKTRKKGPRI